MEAKAGRSQLTRRKNLPSSRAVGQQRGCPGKSRASHHWPSAGREAGVPGAVTGIPTRAGEPDRLTGRKRSRSLPLADLSPCGPGCLGPDWVPGKRGWTGGDDHRCRRLSSEAFPGDTQLVFIEFF